jgi:uncharacterized protein YndB with AHSA1/START domain
MAKIHAEAERTIDAPPNTVYAFLADYRKRPEILTPNFIDYKVEQGGRGNGTVVSYRLNVGRRERAYTMKVDEPKKGKTIRERDTGSSLVTVWTVSPVAHGKQSNVKISTEWESSGTGIGGFMERRFAPGGLSKIYDQMLSRLDQAISGGAGEK